MVSSLLRRVRAAPMSFSEFVIVIAATMAIYALAIDTMLPALPMMGRQFLVRDDNQLQWVITLFVVGGGFGQLFYGPLSDRLGRRPVLLLGLFLYVVLSLAAAFATSLPMMLVLRVTQGLAAAVAAVIPRSIVRDRHAGPQMAKVMSITFIVFLIVPVLAPTVGQALLLILPWQGIFAFLGVYGSVLALWIALRMPETMDPDHRRSLNPRNMIEAAIKVLSEPTSLFYSLATAFLMGGLFAYISTLPQIFEGFFHHLTVMPTIFAICAGTMAVSSFFNVQIVEKVGMRRVSHGALLGFVIFSAIHAAFAVSGRESLPIFALFQALTMASFGLAVSNFNAIAMHHMAAIAGSAASVQGVITTIGGALLGALIGHQWHGDVTFLPAGTFCCGAVALILIVVAEKGRLFREDEAPIIASLD